MRKEIKIESEDQGKLYPEILMPEAWKDALENADEETLLIKHKIPLPKKKSLPSKPLDVRFKRVRAVNIDAIKFFVIALICTFIGGFFVVNQLNFGIILIGVGTLTSIYQFAKIFQKHTRKKVFRLTEDEKLKAYQTFVDETEKTKSYNRAQLDDYNDQKRKIKEKIKTNRIPIFFKFFQDQIAPKELYLNEPSKNRNGLSEIEFLSVLIDKFKDKILFNRSMKYGAWYPDFIYHDKEKKILIDIEVDEPYAFPEMEPIHYLDKDIDRNQYFRENNWFIIRFAEEQVITKPILCAEVISNLIKGIETLQLDTINSSVPTIKKWTYEEAILMAKDEYRKVYLS